MSRIHEIRSERAKINDRVQALAKLEAENAPLTAERRPSLRSSRPCSVRLRAWSLQNV